MSLTFLGLLSPFTLSSNFSFVSGVISKIKRKVRRPFISLLRMVLLWLRPPPSSFADRLRPTGLISVTYQPQSTRVGYLRTLGPPFNTPSPPICCVIEMLKSLLPETSQLVLFSFSFSYDRSIFFRGVDLLRTARVEEPFLPFQCPRIFLEFLSPSPHPAARRL